MGVVSGCCYKEVQYIDILIIIITFPTPLVLALFLAATSLLVCSFLKMFFFLVYVVLCNIAKVAQRTFEIVPKLGSRK